MNTNDENTKNQTPSTGESELSIAENAGNGERKAKTEGKPK